MACPIILETRLPLGQCKDQLASNIDIERVGVSFTFTGYAGSRPIVGRIDGSTFRLQKRRYYRNSFAPFFFGKFVASEFGTRIEGSFRMHRSTKIFIAVWFSFLAVLAGASVTSVFAGRSGFQPAMLALPGMAIFGIVLVKFGQWLGRSEEKTIVEFLKKTFEASNASQ